MFDEHGQAAEVRSRLVLYVILVFVWLCSRGVASIGHVEIGAIVLREDH